jgi:hypothetical protein
MMERDWSSNSNGNGVGEACSIRQRRKLLPVQIEAGPIKATSVYSRKPVGSIEEKVCRFKDLIKAAGLSVLRNQPVQSK